MRVPPASADAFLPTSGTLAAKLGATGCSATAASLRNPVGRRTHAFPPLSHRGLFGGGGRAPQSLRPRQGGRERLLLGKEAPADPALSAAEEATRETHLAWPIAWRLCAQSWHVGVRELRSVPSSEFCALRRSVPSLVRNAARRGQYIVVPWLLVHQYTVPGGT